jgi:hypothetical protein
MYRASFSALIAGYHCMNPTMMRSTRRELAGVFLQIEE